MYRFHSTRIIKFRLCTHSVTRQFNSVSTTSERSYFPMSHLIPGHVKTVADNVLRGIIIQLTWTIHLQGPQSYLESSLLNDIAISVAVSPGSLTMSWLFSPWPIIPTRFLATELGTVAARDVQHVKHQTMSGACETEGDHVSLTP